MSAAGAGGPWRPSLGAWREGDGVRFRLWAPARRCVEVVLEGPRRTGESHPLEPAADGIFTGLVGGLGAGDRYRYRLDGEGPYPDPASRFQPEGVHGPSEVVDAGGFGWSDAGWCGVGIEELVLYELHVGTFTPEGTFAGVTGRLPHLRDLGVTAIELMPVADFPGRWNWGYDGVDLFAPARCYGRPDDLRRLVDAAHRIGLGVLLDVVYNHTGPDGAYLAAFSPHYFSKRHRTPWGAAVNLDGPHARAAREFFIENAAHWVHEYHVDGLRLDATHALVDESPRHFLAELAGRLRESAAGRRVLLIAEDHRNLACMVRAEAEGGFGLDAVWADDLHHQIRRGLAGDHEGYYGDFTGTMPDIAATVGRGWFYTGQHAAHFGAPRGTDPAGLPPRRFVVCLQNHDQVGNRALGERLHHQIAPAAYRAATVLLLCAPQTPLLFMGQEWAASTPFLYFTDHDPALGRLVTEGRRREFADFAAFADPAARARIPDPQDPATVRASRLDWAEAKREPHAGVLRLHRALLALRRAEPALRHAGWDGVRVAAAGDGGLVLVRGAGDARTLVAAIRLGGPGAVDVGEAGDGHLAGRRWEQVLSSEDPRWSPDPAAVDVDLSGDPPVIRFARPGAVVLAAA